MASGDRIARSPDQRRLNGHRVYLPPIRRGVSTHGQGERSAREGEMHLLSAADSGYGTGWPAYGIGLKVSIPSSKTGRIWLHSLTGAVMYSA